MAASIMAAAALAEEEEEARELAEEEAREMAEEEALVLAEKEEDAMSLTPMSMPPSPPNVPERLSAFIARFVHTCSRGDYALIAFQSIWDVDSAKRRALTVLANRTNRAGECFGNRITAQGSDYAITLILHRSQQIAAASQTTMVDEAATPMIVSLCTHPAFYRRSLAFILAAHAIATFIEHGRVSVEVSAAHAATQSICETLGMTPRRGLSYYKGTYDTPEAVAALGQTVRAYLDLHCNLTAPDPPPSHGAFEASHVAPRSPHSSSSPLFPKKKR